MVCFTRIVYPFLVYLMLGASMAWPQTTPPAEPTTAPKALESTLQPEAIVARKAALQAQLDTLGQSGLPKEELDKAREPLEQMLQTLTALEDAFERRDTYAAELEARPPGRFPEVTQQLHDQYEAQLQVTRADIQDLYAQTSAGEARLAAIAKELEQHNTERPQLERHLLVARSKVAKSGEPSASVSEVERLEAQLQLLRVDVDALEAEREWLTERGPLHDALLRVGT